MKKSQIICVFTLAFITSVRVLLEQLNTSFYRAFFYLFTFILGYFVYEIVSKLCKKIIQRNIDSVTGTDYNIPQKATKFRDFMITIVIMSLFYAVSFDPIMAIITNNSPRPILVNPIFFDIALLAGFIGGFVQIFFVLKSRWKDIKQN